jgi:hypothetical protein
VSTSICPLCGSSEGIYFETPEDRLEKLKKIWDEENLSYMQESSRRVLDALGMSAKEIGDRLITQNDLSKKAIP